MYRTIIAIIIMAVASLAGLFLGSLLENAVGGMLLLALISGIACIIYTIDNKTP